MRTANSNLVHGENATMNESEFKVIKVTGNWYIGRGHHVAFFGGSEFIVRQKHADYAKATGICFEYRVRSGRIAQKIMDQFP